MSLKVWSSSSEPQALVRMPLAGLKEQGPLMPARGIPCPASLREVVKNEAR